VLASPFTSTPRFPLLPLLRVACLLVLDLPVAAECRAHPELRAKPLAVVSEPGPRALVLSASPEAVRCGIRHGATLAHARSLCAELVARVASPARERAAREALLDVALSAAPRAEAAPLQSGLASAEAAVYLDASGIAALFHSEAGLAAALITRAAALGLPVSVAVASSRFLARLAARTVAFEAGAGVGATRVLAPGTEATFLAPLPVDLLDPDDALADTLTRFGIHRIGQLLALPRRALQVRLGRQALSIAQHLIGDPPDLPLPVPERTRSEEAFECEVPIENLEALTFVLRAVLSRLLERLALRGLACPGLELVLRSPDGNSQVRRLALAAPTRDPRVLLRRLRTALESDPPRAPVDALELATEGCAPRRDQLDLFRAPSPPPAELDALLAELEAWCGSGRIGHPAVADDHRPGAFDLRTPRWEFATAPVSGKAPAEPPFATPPRTTALALRNLRPPLPARVRLRGTQPVWLASSLGQGPIVHCAGPWRSSGGWWCDESRFATLPSIPGSCSACATTIASAAGLSMGSTTEALLAALPVDARGALHRMAPCLSPNLHGSAIPR
jgi:protein ImuB